MSRRLNKVLIKSRIQTSNNLRHEVLERLLKLEWRIHELLVIHVSKLVHLFLRIVVLRELELDVYILSIVHHNVEVLPLIVRPRLFLVLRSFWRKFCLGLRWRVCLWWLKLKSLGIKVWHLIGILVPLRREVIWWNLSIGVHNLRLKSRWSLNMLVNRWIINHSLLIKLEQLVYHLVLILLLIILISLIFVAFGFLSNI